MTELMPLNDVALAKITELQNVILGMPQIDLKTEHVIHGGIYTRTVRLEPETVLVGAHIKIPTTLVVNGHTRVYTGTDWIELEGFHVIPASAGRKQIFVTVGRTEISMFFRTEAKTVEEAEAEFTDESKLLMSRRQGEGGVVTVTGE